HLPLILSQMEKAARKFPGAHPVLAADHLSEGARRELQERGIGFVDGAGNVRIKFGTVLIDRQILPPVARPRVQRPLDRLVSRKYARVLRVLLEHHDRPWGVRELSQEAGISFRHAWVALDRLAEEGWVEKKRGQNRLAAPGTLLDFWAGRYPWKRHQSHRFYAPVRSFDDLLERLSVLQDGTTYALTGPAGSMLVAPFVTFAVHYLYSGAGLEPFQRALDLRPVETGGANIVIVEPDDPGVFYGVRDIRGYPVACNTQLYLDLMALGGRGKDQATHLREQVMKI
ncbi:MAG: type IV toxin-antitoxin system AbiEi family antitoxin, partial [bacterium]